MDWEGLGIMPFVNPHAWKKALLEALQLSETTLRIVGAISIILGVALLYAIK